MTEEPHVPRSGATASDPYTLATAADDLADAMRLVDLAQRTAAAEQQRLQLLGAADRSAVLAAWRDTNLQLQEAVTRVDRASKALIEQAMAIARTLPDSTL